MPRILSRTISIVGYKYERRFQRLIDDLINYEIKIEPIGLEKNGIGEKVTIVPLMVDIPAFELKIVKATKTKSQVDICDESEEVVYWENEFEKIERQEFYEAEPVYNRRNEYPFDVCLIYPAVKFAKALSHDQLTKEMIPRGVTIETISAAIDLTNDKRPDLLIVRYCCEDSTKSSDNPKNDCHYHCKKYYQKIKSKWVLITTATPC